MKTKMLKIGNEEEENFSPFTLTGRLRREGVQICEFAKTRQFVACLHEMREKMAL